MSECALESCLVLCSRKLREDGGNPELAPAELLSNSGAAAISSNGDSEPTSSSEDSSFAILYKNIENIKYISKII